MGSPKTRWELTRSNILAADVPANTDSYTAIPHRVFLEEISAELSLSGYNIVAEEYMGTKGYQAVTGSFIVNKRGELSPNTELAPTVFFVNSYNKTRKASIHAGAKVLVCKNGMMGTVSSGHYSRKHQGNALEEFRSQIKVVIATVDEEFKRLETNVAEMKLMKLNKDMIARLVGDMIMNEDLINNTQLSILKHEISYSKTFNDGSLWSFYNNCTQAFKETHPLYYDKQHIKLHTYLTDKFTLTGARGLYGNAIIDDNSIPFLEVED